MTRATKRLINALQREISELQRELEGKRPPHGEVVCDARGYAKRTKWPSNFNRADRELQRKFGRLKDARRLVSEYSTGAKSGNRDDWFSGVVPAVRGDRDVLGSVGEPAMSTCYTCEGTGADSGALREPEPCPTCFGAGQIAGPEEEVEFDYDMQAWTRDGKYVICGHSDPRCGCYGKVHAGELVRRAS